MNKFIWLMAAKIIAFIAVVGLVVYFMLPANSAELKAYEGDTPALVLNSLKGEAMDLEQLKGKLTMVQLWATYCAPCRAEMPSMNRLQAKLGDGFKILAVNMGEGQKAVQQFADVVKN